MLEEEGGKGMGFNFRKSIKLGGGVRLNLSKRGVGVSAGFKGFRVGVGPRGTRVTAGIPGTGLSYSKSLTGSRKRRVAEQRRRELATLQREQYKMAELERARFEVELFGNLLEVITSVHKDCSEPYDWNQIKTSSPPFKEGEPGPNEQVAKTKLDQFKPTWRDRLFGRVEIRKKVFLEEIDQAKAEDKRLLEEWQSLVSFAGKVLNGEKTAYLQVIEQFAPFDEIEELGSSVKVTFINLKCLEASVDVQSHEVIPSEVKSLTKTGKLSIREMPKTKFNELYQDYVCSCVIRVARELFALLPVEQVIVNALGEVLNTKTGHTEEGPILSVAFQRETLEKLNFDDIDCSDSMANFPHNMKFKKVKGFELIEKISPIEYGKR
ncbi:DUF4236 domain-containing protein [Brevibacillus borstelensis]|uniref:DUF4236 domain-containing protein n=1 Tax=Brevibacillus borstelensis TaxID=45462 RepID=UPI001E59620D|nr:DUF4236 domain-containing protein [Brevibacillus borstelensis]